MTDLEKVAETLAPLPEEVRELKVRVGAVESQIVQLRADMNGGFSAIRGESRVETGQLREDIAALGRETAAGLVSLVSEMRTLHEDLIDRIARLDRG